MASSTDIDAAALQTQAGFETVEVHPRLGSTMERAREIAADWAVPVPALVLAEMQTAGHGRRGARWWQPPGSLAVSIVLDHASAGCPAQPTWSLACGVALAEAIARIEPTVEPLVRWPNDLEVGGQKIAGLLVEAVSGGRVILGIGVNTTGRAADAPEPIRARLATLHDLTGRSLPRTPLLVEFLPRFLDLIRRMHDAPHLLVERYRPRCSLTGGMVSVFRGSQRLEGTCRGITVDGSLIIDTASGREWIASGSLTDPADVWTGG